MIKEEFDTVLEQYNNCMERSSWYYAYDFVSDYCDLPFTELHSEVLFQVSLYLINSLRLKETPRGISRMKVLYTLAKHACLLGAWKVAQFAFRCLQDLRIPPEWEERIELDSMLAQVNLLLLAVY